MRNPRNYGPQLDRQRHGGSPEPTWQNYNEVTGHDSDYGQQQPFGPYVQSNENPFRYGQDEARQSHFGKGPKGYKRSDERIRDDANEALYMDQHIDATDIEVEVKDGVITLSGTVNSRFAKRHAEDCVHHLAGVQDVNNTIRVQKTEDSSSASAASKEGATTGKKGSAH